MAVATAPTPKTLFQPKDLGSFTATAYGPPWDAMNGTGITATGISLNSGQKYVVAADPSVLPMGSVIIISPDPLGASPSGQHQSYMVADTGGGIKGKHVDVFMASGRSAQLSWGSRQVDVKLLGRIGSGKESDYQKMMSGADPKGGNSIDLTGNIFGGHTPNIDVGSALADIGKILAFIFSRQFLYIAAGLPIVLFALYMIYKAQR